MRDYYLTVLTLFDLLKLDFETHVSVPFPSLQSNCAVAESGVILEVVLQTPGRLFLPHLCVCFGAKRNKIRSITFM